MFQRADHAIAAREAIEASPAAPLKTEAGKREVILAPALARALRERWLASRHKTPSDFVFPNTLGRGLDYRDVGEGFGKPSSAPICEPPAG